jgi:hypothetical protein
LICRPTRETLPSSHLPGNAESFGTKRTPLPATSRAEFLLISAFCNCATANVYAVIPFAGNVVGLYASRGTLLPFDPGGGSGH